MLPILVPNYTDFSAMSKNPSAHHTHHRWNQAHRHLFLAFVHSVETGLPSRSEIVSRRIQGDHPFVWRPRQDWSFILLLVGCLLGPSAPSFAGSQLMEMHCIQELPPAQNYSLNSVWHRSFQAVQIQDPELVALESFGCKWDWARFCWDLAITFNQPILA